MLAAWISTKLLGVRRVLVGGVESAERPAVNFIGGFAAADNAAENRTDITLSTSATATGSAIVVRRPDGSADFGGLSTFLNIAAADYRFAALLKYFRVMTETPVSRGDGWIPHDSGTWRCQTTGGVLQIPLEMPHGSLIEEIHVTIEPAGSHVGLPAVMPRIILVYYDVTTRADVTLSTTTDTSANVGAYQTPHDLVIMSGHTIDRTTRRYRIDLVAESGANALTDCTYHLALKRVNRPVGSSAGQD